MKSHGDTWGWDQRGREESCFPNPRDEGSGGRALERSSKTAMKNDIGLEMSQDPCYGSSVEW